MHGSDLIVEIPWLFFVVSLAAIFVRIRRSRGPHRRPPRDSQAVQPALDRAGSDSAPLADRAPNDQHAGGEP